MQTNTARQTAQPAVQFALLPGPLPQNKVLLLRSSLNERNIRALHQEYLLYFAFRVSVQELSLGLQLSILCEGVWS